MGVNLKNRKIAPTCVTLKLIDQKRLYVCNVSSKLWDLIIIWSSKPKTTTKQHETESEVFGFRYFIWNSKVPDLSDIPP